MAADLKSLNAKFSATNRWFLILISADAKTVASGSRQGNYARVCKLKGKAWVQIGRDLIGEEIDSFGFSVSMSGDGSIVAIGAAGKPVGPEETRVCTGFRRRLGRFKTNKFFEKQSGQNHEKREARNLFHMFASFLTSPLLELTHKLAFVPHFGGTVGSHFYSSTVRQ